MLSGANSYCLAFLLKETHGFQKSVVFGPSRMEPPEGSKLWSSPGSLVDGVDIDLPGSTLIFLQTREYVPPSKLRLPLMPTRSVGITVASLKLCVVRLSAHIGS